MATIRDVAKESGVSVATVSYVLNDGPRSVSAAKRERVLEVVRRLNYHPNGMARGLARRRADTLGVLFPCVESGILTNTYAFGILEGILTAADERGFNVTLFTESSRGGRHAHSGFLNGRADGLLIVSPPIGTDLIARLASKQIPFVGISVAAEDFEVPSVDVDNVLGARLATEHLLKLGHTRIAHVTGDLDLVSARERQTGFQASMRDSELGPDGTLIIKGSYAAQHRERSKAAIRNALLGNSRPTAIFAANDSLAIAAVETSREIGLIVPDQLSVVGFDDIPSSALITPPLTSVRQPVAEIGREATRLLIDRIRGNVPERSVLLDPELIVRNSTAPPGASNSRFMRKVSKPGTPAARGIKCR